MSEKKVKPKATEKVKIKKIEYKYFKLVILNFLVYLIEVKV